MMEARGIRPGKLTAGSGWGNHMQLEFATLDALLILTYSDSDTLHNSDCAERIINHFLSFKKIVTTFSSPSIASEGSPLSLHLRKDSKLVDNDITEVTVDVYLKPEKIRSLVEALLESSRSLNDGHYRALGVYFKVSLSLMLMINEFFEIELD
ncbi:hypothetical protein L2E82_03502 [Cichorium intybus]|uniref:Uncharacterized protein n=1 Tax=Cichorium intybus TaxID=13427 RepID=A0ACB9H3Z8_CICIN|nr:hypothetical protein L2E82_03502 [Cichorium intybus]